MKKSVRIIIFCLCFPIVLLAGWFVEKWDTDAPKKPKYVFCGHIHSGNHNMQEINGTFFANVSYVDESYSPTNNIFSFDFKN